MNYEKKLRLESRREVIITFYLQYLKPLMAKQHEIEAI